MSKGLYIKFNESRHPIWIGTHKYGMVPTAPNCLSNTSIRKLFTVSDATNAFKRATSPDLDETVITLHFELDREEPILPDCLLVALQLENSFENPLYMKFDQSVRSIQSKNPDSVKYAERSGEIFYDTATNFDSPPNSSMAIPHRLVEFQGKSYFIGRCEAGDYAVHSHDPKHQEGYAGSEISFLLDNGFFKTVKGPFVLEPSYRDYHSLVAYLRMDELNRKAFRVAVGIIHGITHGNLHFEQFEATVYEEQDFSLSPISSRIHSEWYGCDLHLEIKSRFSGQITIPLLSEEDLEQRIERNRHFFPA